MKFIRRMIRRPRIFIPLSLILLVFAGYFAARGIILRKALSIADARFRKSAYSIHWDEVRFRGFKTVFAEAIYIQSLKGSNEIIIDSLAIRVRLLPLITKKVRIRKLDCRSLSVRYSSGDSVSFSKESVPDSTSFFDYLKGHDLSAFAYKNIRRLFHNVPSGLNFGRLELRYSHSGKTTTVSLNKFKLKRGYFTAELTMAGEGNSVILPFSGRTDERSSVVELNVVNSDTGLLPLPVLKDRLGLAGGFDTVRFRMDLSERSRHLVKIKGETSFTGFELSGDRLSSENIRIALFRSNYILAVGTDYLEVDSSSEVLLNAVRMKPYMKISLNDEPSVNLKFLPQRWDAGSFFNSLPPGMFTSLTGTKATGFLNFFLNFSVNLKNPDSLKFNISFKGDDFKVLSFGTDDYRLLNHSFLHKVYSRGNLVAAFQVGPQNPSYVAFADISPYLRAAVMTSEDGSFFYHNGFNPDAFRESIATNIREGRFARGGSTISMQLVKNVFLTRNKTIARKIEEALIVWLIENLDLVPKQRMYEVYLNIIEWGPGIYGASQASNYYFAKKPSQLNLQESVFMASIVPRPKWFKYTFEENGQPRAFYAAYFNRMKELMVRKEFIPASDTMGIAPSVRLTGPAAQVFDSAFARSADTVKLQPLKIITHY